jgi:glutathione S-transferase
MAAGDDLKLLGAWPSPFVTRVKLALNFKGLSFENVEEDLTNKSELLLSSNPVHKKIPVLLHRGKPICESVVIVQYIDEAFAGTGASLLSSDPHERAVARFWAAYIDDKVSYSFFLSNCCSEIQAFVICFYLPVTTEAFVQLVAPWVQSFRGKTDEDKSEGFKQMLAAVETLEGALRECSKGEGYFGGESVGLVDISLGSLLSWLKATEGMSGTKIFDTVNTPLLAAWGERFSELDGAKVALPDVDRVVEFAKKRQAQAAAAAAASET